MQVPFPYLIARALARAALAVYFRGLDVSGRENVPARGPLILAANHPQSVTDAMVLAAAAPRAVHFVAHSGLFENPLRGRLLRASGVIPVYRSGDEIHAGEKTHAGEVSGAGDTTRAGEETGPGKTKRAAENARAAMKTRAPHGEAQDDGRHASKRNIEMFAACAETLRKGGAIGIFPEGVSTEEPRVHKLKTGTARIALGAESQHGWRLGVSVIPVGLTFESRRRMRTRVFVAFGEPIPAVRYRAAHENDPVEAARSMSSDLEKAISRLIVDIERPEFERLVDEVDSIYKKELLAREGLRKRGHEAAGLVHSVEVEIPRALDYFLERRPEVVWRVQRLVREYAGALKRARMRDDVVRDPKETTLAGEIARLAAFGIAGLPLALYGALWSYVPYRFTGFVARGVSKGETKIHYYQIVCGAVFFPLWWAPPVYLATRILNAWGAVIFAASLPLSGLFAHGFVRWLVGRARRIQYLRLRTTHGRFAHDLERKRRLLVAELDIAFAEYVAARLEAGPGPAGGDHRE